MNDSVETIRARFAELTEGLTFDERGICTTLGRFEGSYQSSVYFHRLAETEGEHGEGSISWPDGSWEAAFNVTPEERAALAGPWLHNGHMAHREDWLFVVGSDAQGLAYSSHSTRDAWDERMTEDADQGEEA